MSHLAGVGLNNDAAGLGRPAKDGRGLVAAIETCLEDAQAEPLLVDLVLSGSAGTKVENNLEDAALRQVFGNTQPATGTTKRSTGFAMGAAAFMEVALAVAAVTKGSAPASAPKAVPGARISSVLCNAIGLNGQFGAALIKEA